MCLSACGNDASDSKSKSCSPACTDGKVCKDGECVEDAQKTCTPECTDGKVCKDGECVEDEPKDCTPECTDGKVCKDGECVEDEPKDCTPECTDGKVCKEGECVEDEPKDCTPECTDGKVCKDGECVEDEPKDCTPECTDGKVCKDGECVEDEPKDCTPECTDGMICVDGTCENDPELMCNGVLCLSPKACVDNHCVDVDDGTCESACSNGKICSNSLCVDGDDGTCDHACGNHKVCKEGVCVDGDDGYCTPECKAGEYCRYGVCLQRCMTETGVQCGNLCCENEMSVCNETTLSCERACDAETQILCGANADLCCDKATEVCIYGECRRKDPNLICESARDCAMDAFCDTSVQMCISEKDVPQGCQRDTSNFDFTLSEPKWWWPKSLEGGQSKFHTDAYNVMAVPVVINMTDDNGDGRINENDIPEVVFPSFAQWPDNSKAGLGYALNATLRAVTTDKDGKLVELAASDRLYMGLGEIGAADIDGDGKIEVIASTPTEIHALRLVKDEASETGYRWDTPYKLPHGYNSLMYGDVPVALNLMPSFADLEGDGIVDIITNYGVLIVKKDAEGNANLAWKTDACRTRIGSHTAADLDYNPDDIEHNQMEIVGGSIVHEAGTESKGFILDANCNVLASVPEITGHLAVADLLKDSEDAAAKGELKPEIASVNNGQFSFFKVYKAKDGTGKEVWSVEKKWNHAIPQKTSRGAAGGSPVIADFDGDGQPDVGVAAREYYVVFSNDGTSEGGKVLWADGTTNDSSSAATGSSVFDFQGDGKAEILYADEEEFHVYVGAGSAVDSDSDTYSDAKLVIEPVTNSSGTSSEYPNVADIDNDGHSEIIVTTNDYGCAIVPGSHYCSTRGVRVFGDPRWVRTRRIWNQHDYHVTNINEDGTVPRHETPNWLMPNLNNFRQNVQPVAILVAPNLKAQLLSVNYAQCADAIELIANFVNAGSLGLTDPFKLSLYVKDADKKGHDALISTIDYDKPIVPGVPVSIDYTWNFTAKLLPNASDTPEEAAAIEAQDPMKFNPTEQVSVYFIVDPDNEIAECFEDDNRISNEIAVSCPIVVN